MTFNPLNVAGVVELPPKDHNRPADSAHVAIFQQIDDLFDEAKNWADGEPITSQEMHDAIEKLRDGIHAAGKEADELRKEEKKPLDEAVNALQSLYNPYIQPKRGKVDLAKSTLDTLLTPWRTKIAAAAQAEAARIAAEAAEATRLATEAIRASSGNLAAREEAEELLASSKKMEKTAARTFKAATTGMGLRTVYDVTLVDEELAMDWLWARAKAEVLAVAQRNAEEVVRGGLMVVPGFAVVERKVAR